jgi:chromosome segregation ATPase
MRTQLTILAAAALLAADPAAAQSEAEMKMREALRNTTLQLRTVQGERDALAAEKAENERQKEELTKKFDALTKQAAANQAEADKQISSLKDRLAAVEANLAQHKDALEKWKKSYEEASAAGRKSEAERQRLTGEVAALKRTVEERERQNIELFKVGSEILTRLENFGLGTAIAAREPFVGISRVKLQNQVQDYQDRLLDSAQPAARKAGKPADEKPAPARAKAGASSPAPAKPSNRN